MLPITMRFFTILFATIILFSNNVFAEFKEISKKEFLDSNLKALEKRFDQIDTNKDQKIDVKENEAWRQKVIKARKERATAIQKQQAEIRKKVDTNKDGKISKEEIEIYKKNQKN